MVAARSQGEREITQSTPSTASNDESGRVEAGPASRLAAIAVLALAAIAAAAASLALASGQDRGNLSPPSIAVDGRGLATVAWTEVSRSGIRVAQESAPGRWSTPTLLDGDGGPGSVAIGRDRLSRVAYVNHDGLVVADQLPGKGDAEPAFRRTVVDPRGRGRPSIAVTEAGETAVLYQAEGDSLRLAVRGSSGGWRTKALGVAAEQPQLAPWGSRGIVFAGLRNGRVALGRSPNSASRVPPPAIGTSVGAQGSLRGFSLTTAGKQVEVSFIEEDGEVVIAARPYDRGKPRQVAAITAGVGNFTATAGANDGRSVILYRHPRYRVLTLALLEHGTRLGDIAVDQGQLGDVALAPDGSRASVAYWDYPGGRQLHVARVPLAGPGVFVNRDVLSLEPQPSRASIVPVSNQQPTLPADGKVSIWLAALALLLTIAAGGLLLLGRRRGIRLLPFVFALGLLAGFAARSSYVAQIGVYGLPANDQLTLDRAGVDAVVKALLIVAVATAILCVVGRLLPARLGARALGRLRSVRLPSPGPAGRVEAVFLAVSLLVAAYLLASKGLGSLAKSRQAAFADSGYQLALLYAGAGAWLVYFMVVGWPGGDQRRRRLLLLTLGALTLIPLLVSGTRTTTILGFLVPLILLIHLRVRPIPVKTAVIAIVALMVLAIGMRQIARGEPGTPYLREAAPTTEADGIVASALKPAFGWTEAAAFDGFVLVRTQYLPRFGTDPLLTAGAYAGILVPRRLWPDKPRAAGETFTENLTPWEFGLSKVGQSTSLPGDLTMNWGLAGVFAGFAVLGLVLCLLGELLAGAGGAFGWLLAAALVPQAAASIWADSFSTGWQGIALATMITLAVIAGRLLGGAGKDSQPSTEA